MVKVDGQKTEDFSHVERDIPAPGSRAQRNVPYSSVHHPRQYAFYLLLPKGPATTLPAEGCGEAFREHLQEPPSWRATGWRGGLKQRVVGGGGWKRGTAEASSVESGGKGEAGGLVASNDPFHLAIGPKIWRPTSYMDDSAAADCWWQGSKEDVLRAARVLEETGVVVTSRIGGRWSLVFSTQTDISAGRFQPFFHHFFPRKPRPPLPTKAMLLSTSPQG